MADFPGVGIDNIVGGGVGVLAERFTGRGRGALDVGTAIGVVFRVVLGTHRCVVLALGTQVNAHHVHEWVLAHAEGDAEGEQH